jgi:hypothetical protein
MISMILTILGYKLIKFTKRSFWAHYLEEPLSVIAHLNQEEQHYRMGWLEVTFSGQGSHKER